MRAESEVARHAGAVFLGQLLRDAERGAARDDA